MGIHTQNVHYYDDLKADVCVVVGNKHGCNLKEKQAFRVTLDILNIDLMSACTSEKVLCDKGEHNQKTSGDPSHPGQRPEDHTVPPGGRGARCCLSSGLAHGEELVSDPGYRTGPGWNHSDTGPRGLACS